MRKTASVSIFLIVGILILGIAIFANQLVLDPNPSWGKGRIVIFALGLFIAFTPWLIWKRAATSDQLSRSDLFTFPMLLVVIGTYVWFMRFSYENSSNYYFLLATSFRQGELSLSLKPDPALLKLPDPYDPAERQGIDAPVDLSLYNGKFYLYWGPAPSLILAALAPIFPGKINDGFLLFVFTCGIFLTEYLLMMMIWESFFPDLSKWILLASILGSGLIGTPTWLLTTPKIYETAIAGGQFFLLSGFFVMLTSLAGPSAPYGKLALAGLLFGLAVATRMTLVFPIIFLTIALAYWFYRYDQRSMFKILIRLVSLGLPLFLTALGIAWYNWARFGSISETGLYYQLAGPHLQKYYSYLFSPVYLVQNVYNYLLHPFMIEPRFPFFYSTRGLSKEIFPFYALPELYSVQAVTGLFFLAPFALFVVIPMAVIISKLFKNRVAKNVEGNENNRLLHWVIISLAGLFALTFLLLQMFFWAAMRYMEDFMPTLILLSIIGFWQGYQYLATKRIIGKLYFVFAVLMMVSSIVISFLISLSHTAI